MPIIQFNGHILSLNSIRYPTGMILIELIYFILITSISLYIYFKTKEIYDLTKHKGIYYFRNIFLYFSFAYFFRLIQIFFILTKDFSNELNFINIPKYLPNLIQPYTLFFVSYFSTLAILSVIISSNIRNIKTITKRDKKLTTVDNLTNLNLLQHLFAFIFSLGITLLFNHFVLIVIQTIGFFTALIFILKQDITFSKKLEFSKFKFKINNKFNKNNVNKNKDIKTILNTNKITYFLLFLFWILNSLSFFRRLLSFELKILFYIISILIFLSIMLRVRKRLTYAEKERQT